MQALYFFGLLRLPHRLKAEYNRLTESACQTKPADFSIEFISDQYFLPCLASATNVETIAVSHMVNLFLSERWTFLFDWKSM